MSALSHAAASLAMAVIPPDAPLSERVEILKKYISPAPGSVVEVDAAQVRDKGQVIADPGKLFGTIKVNPPKGVCFTVTLDRARPDVEVCKPTTLKFYLEELDRESASVSWVIKTGPGDFGTPVKWTTPYTIAKILPTEADFYLMNSKPVFFKSCVPQNAKESGLSRQIILTKFDNTKWHLRFPDVDTPIKNEEPPVEPVPETKKAADGHGGGEAKADGHGESGGGAHGQGSQKSEAKAPSEPEKPAPEQWTMNSGRGYEMNVGNLLTDGSMPPGKRGTCRYVYDAKPGDFSIGKVECHHTDQYLYVFMYLKCMGPIRPR